MSWIAKGFGWDFGLVCVSAGFKLEYAVKLVVQTPALHNTNSTIRQSALLVLTFPVAIKFALVVP